MASLDMEEFVEEKSYRLVVQRSPLKVKDGSRLRNLSPDPFWGISTMRGYGSLLVSISIHGGRKTQNCQNGGNNF